MHPTRALLAALLLGPLAGCGSCGGSTSATDAAAPAPVASASAAAASDAAPAPAEPPATPEARVDALVRAAIGEGEGRKAGPGAAVAVLSGGEVKLMKAYGLANVDTREPITTKTIFDLASLSKAFTAAAVLILAERGSLALADDARKVVPELPRHAGRALRIADLLHMTSGLPEYTNDLDDFPNKDALTNADILAFVKKNPPEDPPGVRSAYTNTNYIVAATVVERVAKVPFAEFLQREIFGPAGMSGAAVFDKKGKVIPGRASGYKKDAGHWKRSQDDVPALGDGNVFVSIEDMVAWERALLGKSRSDGGAPLLREESRRALFTGGKLDSGEEHGYGFGWNVTERDGHRLADHSGAWAGTSTYIGRYLDNGLTVIVLSNHEDLDDDLGEKIADVYLSPDHCLGKDCGVK